MIERIDVLFEIRKANPIRGRVSGLYEPHMVSHFLKARFMSEDFPMRTERLVRAEAHMALQLAFLPIGTPPEILEKWDANRKLHRAQFGKRSINSAMPLDFKDRSVAIPHFVRNKLIRKGINTIEDLDQLSDEEFEGKGWGTFSKFGATSSPRLTAKQFAWGVKRLAEAQMEVVGVCGIDILR